jgi:hypothetical protein
MAGQDMGAADSSLCGSNGRLGTMAESIVTEFGEEDGLIQAGVN